MRFTGYQHITSPNTYAIDTGLTNSPAWTIFTKVMILNRILFNLILLIFIFYGCKKKTSEEPSIPVGWHEDLKGRILITWSSTDGYTYDRIFWIDENGTNYLTDANQCKHMLEGADWSPDGTKIVFGCWWGIWIYHKNGNEIQHIDSSQSYYPTWSPDGSQIAFGSNSYLNIFNIDNEELTNFTNQGLMKPKDIDWSPDGKKIVFENGSFYGFGSVNIFNLSDTSFVEFQYRSHCPTWSPDGKFFALIMRDDNNIGQIYISDPDGSNIEQLTHSSSYITGPLSWSPDGKFIAAVNAGGIDIYDLKGTFITRIIEGPNYHYRSVDWGE